MARFVNTDTILGAVFLFLGVALFRVTLAVKDSVFVLEGDAPPYLVPQIYLYLWIAISAVILAGGLRGRSGAMPSIAWRRFLGVISLVIAGATLMPFIGFLISGTATVFGVGWTLGFRRTGVLAGIAVASIVSIWALLVFFARMPLPVTPGLGW